jgi:protein-arginine kinase activator protein McsA
MVRIVCRECGRGFQSNRTIARFCGSNCKNTFNNRRMQRGAVIYDLLMVQRYSRREASMGNAWSLLSKLAQHFKSLDDRERAGRRSWEDLKKVRDRNPYLAAMIVSDNAAGLKRRR